jgi:hypothetical protein
VIVVIAFIVVWSAIRGSYRLYLLDRETAWRRAMLATSPTHKFRQRIKLAAAAAVYARLIDGYADRGDLEIGFRGAYFLEGGSGN